MRTCTNIIRRLKINTKAKKGATLVEMIVTFALLGIFMAAVSLMVSAYVNYHFQSQFYSYAQEVAEMTINKVSVELRKAYSELYVGEALDATNGMVESIRKNDVEREKFYNYISFKLKTVDEGQREEIIYGVSNYYILNENKLKTISTFHYFLYNMKDPSIYVKDGDYFGVGDCGGVYSVKSNMGMDVSYQFMIPDDENVFNGNKLRYICLKVTVSDSKYGGMSYDVTDTVSLPYEPDYIN